MHDLGAQDAQAHSLCDGHAHKHLLGGICGPARSCACTRRIIHLVHSQRCVRSMLAALVYDPVRPGSHQPV